MSKKPARILTKLFALTGLGWGLAATSGCTSTLGLDEYEVTNLEPCNGVLADYATDELNCGACGRTCPRGASCIAGSCACPKDAELCPASATSSAMECTNLLTDSENCAECGAVCPEGAACEDGECACEGAGERVCSGVCVDPDSDAQNCGSCGNACSIPHATASCEDGECVADTCTTNHRDCDDDLSDGENGNGCEVDTSSDDDNCGSCGNACPIDRVCSGGQCVCDVPAAGGECDPRSGCGCDTPGTNCSYVMTEEWQCIPAGSVPAGSVCANDSDCVAGSGCVAGVCYPLCDAQEIEAGTCEGSGVCVQVVDGNNEDIDGYQVCSQPCNPSTLDTAPPGLITCPFDQRCVLGAGTAFCSTLGASPYGGQDSSCSLTQDCQQGYGCIDSECKRYCFDESGLCESSYGIDYVCTTFDPPILLEGSDAGVCHYDTATLGCEDSCTQGVDTCAAGMSCLYSDEYGEYMCLPSYCSTCFGSGYTCSYDFTCGSATCVP